MTRKLKKDVLEEKGYRNGILERLRDGDSYGTVIRWLYGQGIGVSEPTLIRAAGEWGHEGRPAWSRNGGRKKLPARRKPVPGTVEPADMSDAFPGVINNRFRGNVLSPGLNNVTAQHAGRMPNNEGPKEELVYNDKEGRVWELEERGYRDEILSRYFDGDVRHGGRYGESSHAIARHVNEREMKKPKVDAELFSVSSPTIIRAVDEWKKQELDTRPQLKEHVLIMHRNGMDDDDIARWLHEYGFEIENEFTGGRVRRIIYEWKVDWLEDDGMKGVIEELHGKGVENDGICHAIKELGIYYAEPDVIGKALERWPEEKAVRFGGYYMGDPSVDFQGNDRSQVPARKGMSISKYRS